MYDHIMRILKTNTNLSERSLEELKQYCRILFIDDDTDFKTIDIIKRAGWTHTSHIYDSSFGFRIQAV